VEKGKALVKGKAGLVEWWKIVQPFSDKLGRGHRLFFSGQGASARLKVASDEQFDDEFVQKVQAVMATNKVAAAVGSAPLSRAFKDQAEIKRLTAAIEDYNRRGETLVAQNMVKSLRNATGSLAGQMHILIDLLPENADPSFPVQPGQFVTIKYKDTKRKGEILVVSNLHVRYKVDSVDGVLQMDAAVFKTKWGSEILEYVEDTRREQYLGKTPGKASPTGLKVIAKYQTRTSVAGIVEVQWQPGKWWPLLDCDMSHDPLDAVDYWNNIGRHTGRKSDDVRIWMRDPNNYILEPSTINRTRGSRNKANYLLPTK